MSAPHTVPGSFDSAPDEVRAAALVDALGSESRLLGDLHQALLRQRAAVAGEDIEGVEEGVREVQRILLTLNEALTRRRSLIGLLTGSETTDLGALGAALERPNRDIEERAEQLVEAAHVVAGELETTRTLLRGAIATGDHYLRTMTGAEDAESLYRPVDETRQQRQKALLVDRQV